MQDFDCELHAKVAHRNGGVEAQLVEIDIAARSGSIDGLLAEIRHAIIVTYEIAKDLGETPFVSILCPSEICGRLHVQQEEQIGVIELPAHVGEALAAALRLHRPITKIPVFPARKAA
jgi:hypothetical protein